MEPFEVRTMTPDEKTVSGSRPASAGASSERPAFSTMLQTSGKLIVGIAGFFYVTGLLVVTIHLGRYGLNSLILSQLHYVMAGVWAMMPILFASFLAIAAAQLAVEEISKPEQKTDEKAGRLRKLFSKRNRRIASSVFYGLAGVSILLYVVVKNLGVKIGLSWLIVLPAGAIVAFFLLGLGYRLLNPGRFEAEGSLAHVNYAVGTLLFFLLYIILFTYLSYRDIPWSTGGGGSSRIQMVVTTEARSQLENVGIPFSAGQDRSNSLQLLLATDKEYIIINQSGKAVSVPADSVKSVIYEK
jgi:hypothetical protein